MRLRAALEQVFRKSLVRTGRSEEAPHAKAESGSSPGAGIVSVSPFVKLAWAGLVVAVQEARERQSRSRQRPGDGHKALGRMEEFCS